MTPFEYISATADLIEYNDRLLNSGVKALSMDFEEESNLHIYGEHLCLVQIYDGMNYYVVDAWKITKEAGGAEAIKTLLESPVQKIMFGCSSDASIVRKSLGINLKNVYDTRLVANALGYSGGLSEILSKVLHVPIESATSKHKFQMANWMRRPLPPEQIEYALSDVKYLFELKAVLEEKLKNENAALRSKVYSDLKHCTEQKHKRRPPWQKIGGYKALTDIEKIYLKHFFIVRDNAARKENTPATNILEKSLLVEMAKNKDWKGFRNSVNTKWGKAFEDGRLAAELETRKRRK